MEDKIIAFTGPRPRKLCGWKHIAYKNLIDKLVVRLRGYYRKGYKIFLNGAAQGFDQCAFTAVQKMKSRYNISDVMNIVYVPFSGQENRWVVDGCFGQEEYREMLANADEVKILATMPKDDKEFTRCLLNRNTAMVKACDLVLALYDGDDWNETSGGAQDTMRKAVQYGKELHQIHYTIENDCVKMGRIHVIR